LEPLPHSDTKKEERMGWKEESFSEGSRIGDVTTSEEVVKNNWLCWTTLEEKPRHISAPSAIPQTETNTKETEEQPQTKATATATSTSTERKRNKKRKPYLCVLAGPSTLQIFDVFPNPYVPSSNRKDGSGESSSSDTSPNTYARATSVGNGHSISLPFEASSIFPLPPPRGGVLIQRAVTADDDADAAVVASLLSPIQKKELDNHYPHHLYQQQQQQQQQHLGMGSLTPFLWKRGYHATTLFKWRR